MKLIITIFISFLCVYAYAQDGDVVKGNRYYKEGNYEKAEESYRKALEKSLHLLPVIILVMHCTSVKKSIKPLKLLMKLLKQPMIRL